MASTDAKATAYWGVAHRLVFPILDNDGDLVTGAAGLDSEISKDQGTFADCSNEATEIATSSGMYYLDLTAAEMEADCVSVIVKTTTTDAKTTPIVVYPEQGIRTRKAQAGAGGTVTLDASASATDDFYNGCTVRIVGGTGVGQTRLISDYVGSTKVASVVPNWATNPDNTSIFHVQPMNEFAWLYAALSVLAESQAAKSSPYAALATLVHKVSTTAVAGQELVYRSDGSTEHMRRAITPDAAADPITVLGGAA